MKYLPIASLILIFVSCSTEKTTPDAYGNFEAKEVTVSAEMAGKIVKLGVEEGDSLKAGEPVGLIDTTIASLQKQQLEAQYKSVYTGIHSVMAQIGVLEEQKKVILNEKARVEKLFKDSAATDKQMDEIAGQLNVVESQIKSIGTQNATVLSQLVTLEKQIDLLSEQIRKCTVVNPVNGTVLEKYTEEHEIAAPGKALYKIADVSHLFLRVYVSGNQVSMLSAGSQTEVWIDDGQGSVRSLPGTISWISQEAEFTPKIIQTRDERVNLVYAVKIKVKNDGLLKIGMPGEARFINSK